MEWTKDDFCVSTDKGRLNVDFIHTSLSKTYWAENVPPRVVQRSVGGSLCFGVYHLHQQIGFARVITDEATFAYLCDVFIDEAYRGKGLSKWLIEVILAYPGLQGLRRFMLATRDAHGLYRQFGFTELTFTDRWMHIHWPNVYKEKLNPEGTKP
ncbi:MAG TPA: GNAT family N-acetyltransferase [Flavisolibacter sp.]|nr:GNAT family N-acetyltransferase [Flavisolibacter sp.]